MLLIENTFEKIGTKLSNNVLVPIDDDRHIHIAPYLCIPSHIIKLGFVIEYHVHHN